MEKKGFPESAQPDFLSLSSGNDKGEQDDANLFSSLEPAVSSLSRKNRLLSGESTLKCTPWRTKDYSCDPPGLHEEINDFYEYMKPRPSEVRMRMDVISRVMNIILSRWPLARIEPFGSFMTGMFLPTSDVDLVVFGQWASPQPPLFSLEEEFKAHDIAMEGSILVLDKTTVPVIKFIDKVTEVKVDISFNQDTGLRSYVAIQHFIRTYPFLPKLVLVIKQFLTQRNLHEVFYGGISSYSVILLIVSFLQRHPRYAATDPNSANLGVLLIEFFELYGRQFNYMKTGITVENGGSYIAKDEIPTQDFLYIKDPTEDSLDPMCNNAARGCYGMWQVKQAFEHAFLRLNSAVLSRDNPVPRRESLLGAIVKVSKEVDDYRNWTDSNWLNHPLSPPTTTPTTTLTPVYYPAAMMPHYPVHPQFHLQQFPPLAMSNEHGATPSVGTTSTTSHSSSTATISNSKS